MRELNFYTLRADLYGDVSPGLYQKLLLQIERYGELRISPHVLLCGLEKQAWLDTQELAETYKAALEPIFELRYGERVIEIVVQESGARDCEPHRERVANDSAIVRARLSQNVMAPNLKPVL